MNRIISSVCMLFFLASITPSPAAAILGGFPQPAHTSQGTTTRYIVKFRDGKTPQKQAIIRVFDEAGMAILMRPLFTVDRVGPEYLGMEKPSEIDEEHAVGIDRIAQWIAPPAFANHCTNPIEVHNTGSCPAGFKRTGTCIKPGSPTNCTPINNPGGGGNPGGGNSTPTPTPSPTTLAPGQPTPTPGSFTALGLGAFSTFRQIIGQACVPNQPLSCGQSGALTCDGTVNPPVCKISECLGQQCTGDAILISPFVSPQLQNIYAIITEDPLTVADFTAIISQVPDFEEAWPDLTLHAQVQPNDPYNQQQWAWKNLGLDTLDIQTKNENAAVKIAIIDTGIDGLHEDISGKSVTNGRDYVMCEVLGDGETCQKQKVCQEASHGYCSNTAVDDNGHGTHIAGIITAATGNAVGISAIAQSAQLIPIKVMNANGETFESWLYEGIMYAVHQGAKTVNVSIGGCAALTNADGSCPHTAAHVSPGFRRVIDYAIEKGVTVVVAAGNENDDAQWYTPVNYNNTPGRAGNILVVSATGPDRQRSSYANFGALVDVSAPGGDIISDINGDGAVSTDDCTPQQCILSLFPMHTGRRFSNPNYESHAGTSMAAPFVVAEIALLLTKNPNLSVDEVITLIKEQSRPLSTDHPIGGLIDPVAALDRTQEASNINYVDPQCDLCGWCSPGKNPKPANWDSCQSCLYTPSGDRTNKSYTVLGCVEATSGDMVQTILRVVLGISGGIAFLAFLFGSYAVMTAGGDPHQVTMGKDTIVSALIGLCTILFSIFILRLFGVTIFQIPGFS